MNLTELQKEAHAIAKEKGWWDEECTFGDLTALVHSELSEALEAYRERAWQGDLGWRWVPILDDETAEIIGNKPVGVASELADVVIRVANMAEFYGVDLAAALDAKSVTDVPALEGTTFGEWITVLHHLVSMTWVIHQAAPLLRPVPISWHIEVARVIKTTQRMAAHYGIDLDAAIAAKMAYNRTRPYRHGGKAL